MDTHIKHNHYTQYQTGVALPMVMMILLVIVTLSVSLALGVFGEHRLSRNTADLAIARQAAEAALRDAEHDLLCERWDSVNNTFVFHSSIDTNANKGLRTNIRNYCTADFESSTARATMIGDAGMNVDGSWGFGLRRAPLTTSTNIFSWLTGANTIDFRTCTTTNPSVLVVPTASSQCIQFGAITEQLQFSLSDAGVSQPQRPVYAVEVFMPTTGGKVGIPTFRITARGYGRNPSTTVDLQSVFRPLDK